MQGWYAPILLNSTGMSETVNPATGMYYLAPTTWTESLAHVTETRVLTQALELEIRSSVPFTPKPQSIR